MYFERGRGSRIWDVDGNEYIDYIMAYGAVLLGYAEEAVDRPAIDQIARGKLLSLNHPIHLRFLEAVLRRFPAADRAFFAKTGSEATTAALRIARRFTGRRKVVRCGFHGWHDWCFPEDSSVATGLGDQVLALREPTAEALAHVLDESSDDAAAVILAPEMVLPLRREAVHSMIEMTHRHGALFILDEIKTGFRAPGGSVQTYLDVRPDITTLSKALGNGWPIAAVVGRADVMEAGRRTHLSATYHGETAAMAAALACMEMIDREHVQDHVARLGARLIEGLSAIVSRHGVVARAYAEPLASMPFLAFAHPDERVRERMRTTFFSEMFARGILLHPRHLWYTSWSHTEADIDRTLAAADEAMAVARGVDAWP